MCSTPRPKRTVNVKATPRVVSIMASMDEKARHRFTERANEVAERKEATRKEEQALRLKEEQNNIRLQNQIALIAKKQKKSLSYWFFSASFAEVFKKLTTGN